MCQATGILSAITVVLRMGAAAGLEDQETFVGEDAEVQVIPSAGGSEIGGGEIGGGDVGGGIDGGIDGDAILAEHFAPWVQELGLKVEQTGADFATLRLPWSARLAREGGAMSGQALMAAADTATVIAISAAKGGFGPMTTVQLSTTFQRPVLGKDVLVTAKLTKLGRSLAFADITMTAGDSLVAQATTVYAIL